MQVGLLTLTLSPGRRGRGNIRLVDRGGSVFVFAGETVLSLMGGVEAPAYRTVDCAGFFAAYLRQLPAALRVAPRQRGKAMGFLSLRVNPLGDAPHLLREISCLLQHAAERRFRI